MEQQKITAELILASRNAATGDTLYTFILTFPRMILPEIGTHRVGSKNTASSRAIPAKKQRSKVLNDPFVPLYIGQNQRGMQAGGELNGWRRGAVKAIWRGSRYGALAAHWGMEKLGVHKQIANRLIEPWTWTQMIFSATDLDGLFEQRCHKDAEPHFNDLACKMREEVAWATAWLDRLKSTGKKYVHHIFHDHDNKFQILQPGQWHLPFVDSKELAELGLDNAKKVSAARCARVSYYLPENGKTSTLERDLELYERLAGSKPQHLSPLEHPAMAMGTSDRLGNFKGWMQFRKELEWKS